MADGDPTTGGALANVSLRGWRTIMTRALADKVGILSDIIVAESLDALDMTESEMHLSSLNRFLVQVYQRLPDDVDRRQLVFQMQQNLIRQLYAALRRDLISKIDNV